MRKYYRICTRFVVALVIISLFYISQKVFSKQHSTLPTVTLLARDKAANLVNTKDGIVDIDRNLPVPDIVGHRQEHVRGEGIGDEGGEYDGDNDVGEKEDFEKEDMDVELGDGDDQMKGELNIPKEEINQDRNGKEEHEQNGVHAGNNDPNNREIMIPVAQVVAPKDEVAVQEIAFNPHWGDVTYPPFVKFSDEKGLGEFGNAVKLELDETEQKESERLYKLNYFNQYISDRVSIHRRLRDSRDQECQTANYGKLPEASVILCFHNEAWSVLLRSVHSILDRSPPQLLKEIILVDDLSTMEHTKTPLDKYMSQYPKVKIVRAEKREGLTRARLLGYDIAQAPVLVFLDSHIECYPGWLEPLLAGIANDPRTITVPNIVGIDRDNFRTSGGMGISLGIFKWNGLTFTWRGLKQKERDGRKAKDPVKSPTMPGGLFAIDKKWFTTLGTYDPGLDYWGGENIELSFKTWMCNGSIEMVPCSNVGHIFRAMNPITWPVANVVPRNSMRVAEVWMDSYKELFYDHSYPRKDFGDVSGRIKLRQSLHCHDFKWYVDKLLDGDVPPAVIAKGEIKTEAASACLDSLGEKEKPSLYQCHGIGGNQWWAVTEGNYIMQNMKKLCVSNGELVLDRCTLTASRWLLDYEKKTIQHMESKACLELKVPWTLVLAPCSGGKNQRWTLPVKKTS